MAYTHPVVLASGRSFDPGAPRSAGVLDGEQLEHCRATGIALAYDPVQIGWVSVLSHDDVAADERGPSTDEMRGRQAGEPSVRPAGAWPSTPFAGTPRLSFRRWRTADAPLYARYLGDPAMWKYLPERPPAEFTESVARALIEVLDLESRHDVSAVLLDGLPVGQVRMLFDQPGAGMRAAEVSYWIAREYWGRGLGASALGAYTQQCFERLSLDLVYAWIHLDNKASIRLAERAGYRRDRAVDPRQLEEPRRAGCGRWIRTREDVESTH